MLQRVGDKQYQSKMKQTSQVLLEQRPRKSRTLGLIPVTQETSLKVPLALMSLPSILLLQSQDFLCLGLFLS